MVYDANVARREIVLGSRDSDNGWRDQTFVNHTIQGQRVPRGSSFTYQGVGVYAREDMMFLTNDPVEQYDQLYTSDSRYYEVKTKEPTWLLDSFMFWDLQCTLLPFYEGQPSAVTWLLTRPRDPRYRTKLFLDTYLRSAQITKNNDSTQADFAVIWAEPPYPMALEFRAPADAVQGLFFVSQPTTSTPHMNYDNKAYAYTDTMPITVAAIDSEGCNGDTLHHKMLMELKYVLENYPEGSLRGQMDIRPTKVHLGSTTLYQSTLNMDYRRSKNT